MKILELTQKEIYVLWSAVVAQACTEKHLSKSSKDYDNFRMHSDREIYCDILQDKIRRLGVTGINS